MIGVASLMSGPSDIMQKIMPFPDTIDLVIPGLFLTGFATAFTTIGTYHEMKQPYLDLHGGSADTPNSILLYDKDKIGDVLAGLYNAASSIGVILGPFVGSYVMIYLDDSFRRMHDVFALISAGYASILLVVVYIPNRFCKSKR